MKRLARILVVASLLLVLAVPTASAQSYSYKDDMTYQLKAGFTSSSLRANDYQDSGAGIGWAASAGLYLPLFTHWFGVQGELMYVSKRTQATITDILAGLPDSSDDDYSFNVEFVEFPLMAQLALSDSEDLRFYLLGGQTLGLKSRATVTYTDSGGTEQTENLEGLQNLHWSPTFGLGFIASKFVMEYRFTYGVVGLGDTSEFEAKVNSMNVMLGVAI